MKELEINEKYPSNVSVLNNTGGPRSRTRAEKITSSIFDDKGLILQTEIHCIRVPPDENDIEGRLIEIAQHIGWNNLEEAITNLALPADRLLVIPCGPVHDANTDSLKIILRSALILSKCNQNYYNPDSPMIFTINRLHRNVELIKINLSTYYGLD